MKTTHYLTNAPSPLFFLRLPWPMPPWPDVIKAMSPNPARTSLHHLLPVRTEHDLDGTELPGLRGDLRAFAARLEAAFAGGSGFPKYTLLDWRDGRFVLARGPA
jgi:hypothetical protein